MNNKDGLDEMQRERHSRIGSQMFVIMSFALLFNIALYGAGIRLLDYPADTMTIVIACSGVYLVRLILAGAYQHPRIPKTKTIIMSLTIAIVLAIVLVITLRKLPASIAEDTDDYAAYILVGISAIGLLAAGIAAVIKKKRDKDDEED